MDVFFLTAGAESFFPSVDDKLLKTHESRKRKEILGRKLKTIGNHQAPPRPDESREAPSRRTFQKGPTRAEAESSFETRYFARSSG